MTSSKLYHIFILQNILEEFFDVHYPKELINLIIMSEYPNIKVSCGAYHTIIYGDKIYICGNDMYKKLESHNSICSKNSKLIELKYKDMKKIICGYHHFIGLSYNPKQIYVWGKNFSGQLGLGHRKKIFSPQLYTFETEIKSITCISNFVMAVMKDGTLYVWGYNLLSELGLNDTESRLIPTRHSLSDVAEIFCGDDSIFAILNNSECYAWGNNCYGKLCLDYNIKIQRFPTKIKLKNILSISCGESHTCALIHVSRNINEVYAWGSNYYGQLGLGYSPLSKKNSPRKVLLSDVISVTCGNMFTMALTSIGKIYHWGFVFYTTNSLSKYYFSPQQINISEKIRSISAGSSHCVVITNNDKIYSFGDNEYGQLGINQVDSTKLLQEIKF